MAFKIRAARADMARMRFPLVLAVSGLAVGALLLTGPLPASPSTGDVIDAAAKAPASTGRHGTVNLPQALRSNAVREKRVIGRSVRGRAIWAYRKGNPAATRKVVILGQMHGNESAGVTVAAHLISSVPVSLDADVWILATLNPDGRAAGTRVNARKVDLNRNFRHVWRKQGVGTRTYSGPSAASEPETRAVAAFLATVRPSYVVGLHQPLVGVDAYAVKDRLLLERLATGLDLPIRSFACSGVCRGTLTGWFNAGHPGAAITVELGPAPSATYLRAAGVPILRAVRAY